MKKTLVVILLVLPGCDVFTAMERTEQLEQEVAALRQEVLALPEGPERQEALARLEELEAELAEVAEDVKPVDSILRGLAAAVALLGGGGALALGKARQYSNVIGFLCRKINQLEPDKDKRKDVIQGDALALGYEKVLKPRVQKAA